MDLGAYVRIGDEEIGEIVKKNNIEVPRLRGYRLMKCEYPLSETEIREMCFDSEVEELEHLIEAFPYFSLNPQYYEYCSWTRRFEEFFEYKDKNGKTHIDWSKIHGWKRKRLKFAIKKRKRRIREQYDMWNKYAGREDVLYIHARIGGNNWKYFDGDELTHQPWFLEKVDDSFDGTYCDIYAKIGGDE